MIDQEKINSLVSLATSMRDKAYCPYSNYQVGSAILASSGKLYGGCNVENASYPVGICAERVAAAKAVSEGERSFAAIAVAVSGPSGYPCGMCRQFLNEFITGDIPIFLINSAGEIIQDSFKALLPHSFGPADMEL
ncbi:MAG: cytidine deaminase [Eubacteriaceae bacterium]|nr:cytidine deaminase [Eubacteriaceae bacterium]